MEYIKELDECHTCEIPQHFIDYILRLKAFELCLKNGNIAQAIKYWNKFFSDSKSITTKKCGCNG